MTYDPRKWRAKDSYRVRFAYLPVRLWAMDGKHHVKETYHFIWLKKVFEVKTSRGWTAYEYHQWVVNQKELRI